MSEQVILSRKEYEGMQKELSELRALVKRLSEQLSEQSEKSSHLETANSRLQEQLKELKQKPFKRSRPQKVGEGKKRGRKKGHVGSGRQRPEQIDQTVRIEAGEACPDCGEAFSSTNVERTRDVVDIDPVRPTVNTRYVIERGWCPKCRRYHESPVSDALPNHRFGFQLMLFVVYQKVALGLSYSKVQQELSLYLSLIHI